MYGKILIQCTLTVKTGLHIGAFSAFSAIGAVDSLVIRNPMTGLPIIPGSSLKGKLRTLLARSLAKNIEHMTNHCNDDKLILRTFGSANPPHCARFQFADCFVTNIEQMEVVGVTEVKAENAINRQTSQANPRYIERVTAGTEFGVNIVYDVLKNDEAMVDLELLAKGMKLLQLDYLGGHGSRGSGRVSFRNFKLTNIEAQLNTDELLQRFAEVSEYELFPG